MIKHKVIDILQKLPAEEIKKLNRLVISPYFNKSPKLTKLYSLLVKYYPEFNQKSFTRDKIFFKLSPGKKYNDSTFRVLMSDLLKLIYRFLVIEGLEQDPLNYKVQQVKELSRRGYLSIAKSELKNSENLKKDIGADYGYCINCYYLESHKYNIESDLGKVLEKKQALKQLSLLSQSDSYLLSFFITELINEYINTIILASKYNLDVSDSTARQTLAAIDMKKLISISSTGRDSYIFDLYAALYMAFDRINSQTLYAKYKTKIKKYKDQLSHEELTSHYSNIINYLILKHNKLKSLSIAQELFDIYELFLKEEYFIDSKVNYLKPVLFRAILINALECKKYEWAEHFIEVYSKKVPEQERMNIYYYGYSILYISLGKYSKALDYINKIKPDNFIFKFDTYNNKLKIYYEYPNPQKAADFIRTYIEYLRKDTFFSEERKKPYKNFIKYVKHLIYCKDGKPGYEADYLKMLIGKEENILHKEWLLDKTAKMMPAKYLQRYK